MIRRVDEMFPGRGTGMGQSHCLAMVSWDVVCRLVKRRGLGILHVEIMNLTLPMKCVTRIMGLQEDLVTLIFFFF